MPIGHRHRCWRQARVAESQRAMRLGRRDQRPDERRLAPDCDLDVDPAGELQDCSSVLGDLAGVDVAGHARDADDLGIRRADCVQECEGVVDAGVAVDDDRRARRGRRAVVHVALGW